MKILYDLEKIDPDFFNNERTEEEIAGIDRIKDFIRQRIAVLKDNIDSEERQDEDCDTIIYILPSDKFGRVEFNYSDGLVDKMKNCFSDNDLNYLATVLQNGL